MSGDLVLAPEPVAHTHTLMMLLPAHEDGRHCGFHSRLGIWLALGPSYQRDRAMQCLREHPAPVPVAAPDEGLDDDDDQDCGCRVHPRWCAWNGPCCDHCSHQAEEAHADCCAAPPPPGRPVERTRGHEEDERE